jgi:hypothetical protein
MRVSVLAFVLTAAAVGCSSGGSGDPSSAGYAGKGGPTQGGGDDSPEISSDATWNDGKTLGTPVVVDANTTLTIAPGATIHAATGVQITVRGTLKVAAASSHAKITSADRWAGIIVAPGGTLDADGLDLENATAGVDVQGGAASARYDDGTITAAKQPFAIEAGGKLTTAHAVVTGSLDTSLILGELDAKYLDYDSNGHDGLTAANDAAIISVEDSELHGNSGTTDMLVSYVGAGTIHVAYTEIKNVHCAFHIERISNLDVSHVTATGDYDGFMLYGSLNNGTRTVTQSNIMGEIHAGVEEGAESINGPTSFTNNYFANNPQDVLTHAQSGISVTSNATAAFSDAHPR